MNPQLQAVLQQVIQAFQGGNFDAADLFLQEVLQNDINSADTIFELGIAYARVNRFMEASAVFNCLQPYKKDDVRIPYNLGLIYSLKGEHQLALAAYDLALKIKPDDIDTLVNKGSTCNDIKNYTLALEVLDRAIQLTPDIPESWSNKGIALNNLNLYLESINAYNEAVKLAPNYHEAWSNKSVPLNKLRRFLEASEACDKALSLKPDYAEAWSNKGVTLNELKRFDEAIAHYDKALSLKPDYVEAWSNKGVTLNELKRFDEAIAHYDKALSLKPDYAEAWSNKGVTLNELKRFDEAITHYDKALSLKPDYAEAWSNKGVTLNELKRFDEAITHYDKALSLKPDYHQASWNKGLSLLLQGDFENGLPLYESRWYPEKISAIAGKHLFEKPTWLGVESLKGKTILLYIEQGLGDFIQFCRYAKLVADLGAKVILEVPQPLAGLMKDLEGVSQLIVEGNELPFFDYQCPLLSLPLALKTNLSNIPNAIRYININVHQNKTLEWKTRLGPKLKPRVGLVWSGNPYHKNDHNRSLLLANVLPFLTSQFEYVSLQKEVREVDKLTLDSSPHILNFDSHLNDFVDTAALIENLDLVISVDTSVAHLSGALGKKIWILLPNVPDWRWLLDREDSPWYPSMKLYRQTSIGDWNSVLDRVKSDLSCH
jgi:tetratricopeptide (TPR) repeat protein